MCPWESGEVLTGAIVVVNQNVVVVVVKSKCKAGPAKGETYSAIGTDWLSSNECGSNYNNDCSKF